MRRMRYVVLLMCMVVFFVTPLQAQQNTIITLGVPSWMESMIYSDDQLLAEFYELHPDVEVVIVPVESYDIPSIAEEPEEYFTAMQDYASSADVLFIAGNYLTPEATTAGYFLNLQPLVETDPNFNEADYYPSALDNYRWDRGMWAIPVRHEITVMLYNPARFDEMGVTYPSPSWTVDDFISTVELLTERDANGEVTQSAMSFSEQELVMLARLFYGQGFYDATALPNLPNFTDSNLAAIIERLTTLTDEDYLNNFQGDYNNVAMIMAPPWVADSIAFGPDDNGIEFTATLLPGNVSFPYTEGIAVSGGTAYPELAYDLARSFAQAFDQNYVAVSPRRGVSNNRFSDMTDLSPELQAIVDQALENALPFSETRYREYVADVFTLMADESLSASDALATLNAEAQTNLETAQTMAETMTIIVNQPELPPELEEGEIALRFGMNMSANEIVNRDAWDALAEQFAADHPEVGYVELLARWLNEEELAEVDCYFRPYNDIPYLSQEQMSMLNVDPFLDADPNFDRNDLIGDVLTQVQRDGMTWAIPMSIRPTVIQYQIEPFTEAGLPLPQNDWSGAIFEETLRVLSESASENDYPYMLGSDVTNVVLLAATFDGLPYDFSTEPYGVNFTDPQSVDAIRRVLDMAVDGIVAYFPISRRENTNLEINDIYMYDTTFSASYYQYLLTNEEERENVGFALYPQGQVYSPARYDVSVGMISANTQHADLCYEWLMTLAHSTDLFYEMPVFQSVINDPALETVQGAELVALYREFAEIMTSPTAVSFRPSGAQFGYFIEVLWLGEVFDHYIEEDGNIDLEAELAEAQTFVEDYRACTSLIEPIDLATIDPEDSEAYVQQFRDCAVQADPEWEDPYQVPMSG